jgi:hypothetical protein
MVYYEPEQNQPTNSKKQRSYWEGPESQESISPFHNIISKPFLPNAKIVGYDKQSKHAQNNYRLMLILSLFHLVFLNDPLPANRKYVKVLCCKELVLSKPQDIHVGQTSCGANICSFISWKSRQTGNNQVTIKSVLHAWQTTC